MASQQFPVSGTWYPQYLRHLQDNTAGGVDIAAKSLPDSSYTWKFHK